MTRSSDAVRRTYDAAAAKYAEAFRDEHGKKPMDLEVLGRFADLARGSGPVWDLGCGPGHTTSLLADLGLDARGLDLSPEMVGQARERYPGVPYRIGDMLDLPFEDDSVAAALSFYSIVHFSAGELEAFLREAFRALKPGGLLLAAFHVGTHSLLLEEFLDEKIDVVFMFFTVGQVVESMEKAGFEHIEATVREPYPEVEYPSRRAYVLGRKSG